MVKMLNYYYLDGVYKVYTNDGTIWNSYVYALETLKLAEELNNGKLIDECTKFLNSTSNEKFWYLVHIHEQLQMEQSNSDLCDFIFRIINRELYSIIKDTQHFLSLSARTLYQILSQDIIYVPEYELYNSLMQWFTYCYPLYQSGEQKRLLLDQFKFLDRIRFKTMRIRHFLEKIDISTLTKDEIFDIGEHIYVNEQIAAMYGKFSGGSIKKRDVDVLKLNEIVPIETVNYLQFKNYQNDIILYLKPEIFNVNLIALRFSGLSNALVIIKLNNQLKMKTKIFSSLDTPTIYFKQPLFLDYATKFSVTIKGCQYRRHDSNRIDYTDFIVHNLTRSLSEIIYRKNN